MRSRIRTQPAIKAANEELCSLIKVLGAAHLKPVVNFVTFHINRLPRQERNVLTLLSGSTSARHAQSVHLQCSCVEDTDMNRVSRTRSVLIGVSVDTSCCVRGKKC
jgi:hypothetical protein